jgi:ABC-2 type transport system ATP-binding protein
MAEEDEVAEIFDVTAGYGNTEVLHGVSLKLRSREIFTLMGPNGSGKSTLIRLIVGLKKPSSGAVHIRAGATSSFPGGAIQLVPQDVALYPFMTARENCIAFAKSAGASWGDAAKLADRALELTGCADRASVQIARLSGGFRRRVNIAAALVGAPRLLVLDEPTVGVDADAKSAIGHSLRVLRDQGLSILIVTHDFDDADALSDRVGFLFDGRIVEQGAPQALIGAAFGARQRIEIVLSAPPTPLQSERLRRWGAKPSDETTWVAFLDLEGSDSDFLGEWRRREAGVKEIKIRQPGLAALYDRLGDRAS